MRGTPREAALVTAGSILLGLAFSYPILEHLSRTGGFYDWDLAKQLHWAAVDSVLRFHQLPLWNPYKCGGIPMLADPLSRIATPFFALSILFGPFLGLNLEIPLHLAIGWSGGYVLARVMGLTAAAAVICATVFAGSSWIGLHVGAGHAVFLASLYMPWVVAMLWMSYTRPALFPAAIGGALVALMLGEGGVYAIAQLFMLAGILGLTLALIERRGRPIIALVVFALFSAGFAAIKLFPMLQLMRAHPRLWNTPEATPLWLILYALLSRNQRLDRPPPVGQWEYWEYGAYVGPAAVLLAGTGIVSSLRRALPWLAAGVIFFTLAMGEGGTWYPWSILHHLPIFSSERSAPRFLISFTLVIGVLAAMGADYLAVRLKAAGSVTIWMVAAAMLADFWIVSAPNFGHAIVEPVSVVTPDPIFRQNFNQTALTMLPIARANQGALNCYDYTDFRAAPNGFNRPGYRGEQYLLGPGTVRLTRWTPNALEFEVATPAANVLVVNQNYFPGWRLDAGRGAVFSANGLLAVRLAAGRDHLALHYRDNTLIAGALVSLLTLILALAFLGFGSRHAGGEAER